MSDSKSAFLKRIGKQIKNSRLELDRMSQEELADKVGIHVSYMGRIERGEANAPVYTLRKIASVLKLKNLEID